MGRNFRLLELKYGKYLFYMKKITEHGNRKGKFIEV